MPASQELLDRGTKLAREVEELALRETDAAMRISAVFNACFRLAMKSGLTPDAFLEFCVQTVGAIVLGTMREDSVAEDGFPDLKKEKPS